MGLRIPSKGGSARDGADPWPSEARGPDSRSSAPLGRTDDRRARLVPPTCPQPPSNGGSRRAVSVTANADRMLTRNDKPQARGGLTCGGSGGQGRGRTADLPIFRPKEPVRERRSEPNSCSGERSSVPIRSAVQKRVLANPLAKLGRSGLPVRSRLTGELIGPRWATANPRHTAQIDAVRTGDRHASGLGGRNRPDVWGRAANRSAQSVSPSARWRGHEGEQFAV